MKPKIELFVGDCLQGMAEMPAVSVDVVVTSPPYNLGVAYSSFSDTQSREEYLAHTGRWLTEVKRVLAAKGSLFLNIGSRPVDPWVPFQVLEVAGRHFRLQNVIHWIKSIAIMKQEAGNYPGLDTDLVVGHYKPINSPRFINDCHEYIFHLTHEGDVPLDRTAIGVPYRDPSNIRRWKSAANNLHCRGNTWFLPYETIASRDRDRPHPATFPVTLPERCILLHGLSRVRRVLDPFAGIGSTAVACTRLGVPFTGFDLDETYIEEARRRVQRAERALQLTLDGALERAVDG